MGAKTKKLPRRPSVTLLQVAAALLIFSVSVYLSVGHDISPWETAVFNVIYGLPEVFLPLFLVVTQFGTAFAALGLIAILVLTKRYVLASQIAVGGAIAYNLAGIAKGIWGRPRPNVIFDDVINRDWSGFGPGFPSGHAALGTALALACYWYLPKRFRLPVAAFIILLLVSRIYMGIHAPLDVVGGFAIGWLSAILAVLAVRKYHQTGSLKVIKPARPRTAR